jgi:hypothetical protein
MATSSPYSTRFKLGAAAVVALAAAVFAVAFIAFDSGDEDPVLQGGDAAVVETLIPRRNAQVPQQTTIGIDVVTGWDAALVVDGVEIPEDQLSRTPEIGLVEFTPGEGRAVDELDPGQNCVTAVIWSLENGRGVADRTIPWCFEVV